MCGRRIEELTPDEAAEDLPGHGWSDHTTAQHIKCYDCASQHDAYETYYAARLKRGQPGKLFQMMPDLDHPGKEIECYTISTKAIQKRNK